MDFGGLREEREALASPANLKERSACEKESVKSRELLNSDTVKRLAQILREFPKTIRPGSWSAKKKTRGLVYRVDDLDR